MKARLNLFAHASHRTVFIYTAFICTVFLATPFAARAEEARVQVAVTETSQPIAGPAQVQQRLPRGLQMAQQCKSGRDDCQTRPQEACGSGLDGCLSLGQSNCKNLPAPNLPGPNTTGLENALKNPGLTPEQRANFEKTKSDIEARGQQAAAASAHFQYARCLQNVTKECRANHC